MKETPFISQKSFHGKIKRSDSKQHLNSHHSFVTKFQQFLEPFNYPFFADKFIGVLRSCCKELAGIKSSIEELQVDFQPPDLFQVKLTVRNSKNLITQEYLLAIADILAYSVTTNPLLETERLNIGLLLPTQEPAIIDFLQEPKVWQMRGERYTPIVNIHFHYQENAPQPWFKYHFVLRLSCQKPVGFISFIQISQPSLITPLISPVPYKTTMLSYGLAPSYWGQGLMSESLSVCVPWFTNEQNVKEIIAFAQVNNQGSRRILQKLQLKDCGLLKNPRISSDLREIYKFNLYKKRY